MPYLPGAFDNLDSDSDVGEIYTPPGSDKHPSQKHGRAANTGEVRSRTLLDLEDEISLCMMSMGAIDFEDPDSDQITHRMEALQEEYQKALLDSRNLNFNDKYSSDDIEETMDMRHDAQIPVKQPLPLKKKLKKWNTVKVVSHASPELQDRRKDKPTTDTLPVKHNTPRTINELYDVPWTSLTGIEKARLMAPLSQRIDPKTGRKFKNKAAPPTSIPTLVNMRKARSTPRVHPAAIAKPKTTPAAWADEVDDLEMDQHKSKKWSTVKAKISDSNPQTEPAQMGTYTQHKVPSFSRPTPQWPGQVSPELKTFEQVQNQMREQSKRSLYAGSCDPGHFFAFAVNKGEGTDRSHFEAPTCDSATQHEARDDAAVENKLHQYVWRETQKAGPQEIMKVRLGSPIFKKGIELKDTPEAIQERVYQQLLAETGEKDPVIKNKKQYGGFDWYSDAEIIEIDDEQKAAHSTHVSILPESFMINAFVRATRYVFTRDETIDILRMCGGDLDTAISMCRNYGGAPHVKKKLEAWLSLLENDDAKDKAESRDQEKTSYHEEEVCQCCQGCEACCPSFDLKEDYLICYSCGHMFNFKRGNVCIACGETSELQMHHVTAKTSSEPGSDITENLVVDWGKTNDIHEGSMWGTPAEEQITKPHDTGSDAKEALAILGLHSYKSIDWDTLQEQFSSVLSSHAQNDPELAFKYAHAFSAIVKHHDDNNCWELCLAPQIDAMNAQYLKMKVNKEKEPVSQKQLDTAQAQVSRSLSPEDRVWEVPHGADNTWTTTPTPLPGWGHGPSDPPIDGAWGNAAAAPNLVPLARWVPDPPFSKSLDGCWGASAQYGDGVPKNGSWCASVGSENEHTKHNATADRAASGWNTSAFEGSPWFVPRGIHNDKLPVPKAPAPTSYTVTYWATIEQGDESIHIPIDSNHVCGPEKAIVEGDAGMRKVWKWVQEKGPGDKVSLQDAFDLAKDIHCNDTDDESEINERELSRATSSFASNRFLSPALSCRSQQPHTVPRGNFSVDPRCYGRSEHIPCCHCN